jgi:kynurenine formamidase
MTLPDYDDLPPIPEGGRSAWGLFGADDSVGLINLQTPERVAAAAGLVRRGAMFPLNAPLDFGPAIAAGRGAPRHRVLHTAGSFGFDDVLDNFFPQSSSQWDSLGHVGYSADAFYNGATEDDVWSGRRNTIEHWAKRGIAGRVVVLDMPRTFADAGRSYDPGTNVAYSVEDLEMARKRADVEIGEGDILLVHTGFCAWYLNAPMETRAQVARSYATPGIAHGEEMCRYLWNLHISAIVSDTFAVEAFPPGRNGPTDFAHRILIGQFGMALGELWWTEDLAADCADDGVAEAFLVSAPLNMAGGIGSTANAVAIK